MKIKSVRLQSFRNHTDSTLELEAFNVVKGGNFQGKSSIGQGISMILTPSTIGLDATGRGFVTKIQRGAQKATITGVSQGSKHTIEQQVVLNTNTTGRTSRATCIDDPDYHPAPFEKLLAANRDALSVCLNTDRFVTMDEKDQKSLLAKLALPKQYDFPEETVAAVNKYLGEGTIDFSLEPFQVIDKAYKLLYKEREACNRQVKDFVVPEPLAAVSVDAASLQAKLTEARERQRNISAERDEATSKNHEEVVKATRIQGKVDALKEKIEAERTRVVELEKRFLSDDKLKALRKTAEGKASSDKLESERQLLLLKINTKKTKVEDYRKIFGASGEECPTCHQEIDSETITRLGKAAAEELKEAQARDTEILREMQALGDVAGALKAIADHEGAAKEKAEIGAVIAEKTKLLQDATAELKKVPNETDVLIPFVKPLDEVDAEITSILEKLQPAMAAEERKKEIATKTEQLAKLKDKAYKVDLLVKYFDKDGIKSVLLSDHVGGFVDKMNVVMAAFDYKVALEIEPEFIFNVTDATGVTTPAKELSGSESLMWLVALQCAVSRAAGIGIVIADRMDTFLPEQRQKANRVLYGLVKDGVLEQIIVIVSDISQEPIKLPNTATFFVEAGTVRRLSV